MKLSFRSKMAISLVGLGLLVVILTEKVEGFSISRILGVLVFSIGSALLMTSLKKNSD